MAAVAKELLGHYPNPESFLGILPYTFVGPITTFHLYFAPSELVTFLCRVPRELGSLDSQLEAARAAWPPDVSQHPGWIRRVPYGDIRRVLVTAGRGRWIMPSLLVRMTFRPGINDGHGSGMRWYFQFGTLSPDPDKARYAKDLLPRILPMRVELKGF